MSETSNAPETIWVTPARYNGTDGNQTGTWGDWRITGADEYTRTDAITPQQAAKVLLKAYSAKTNLPEGPLKNGIEGYSLSDLRAIAEQEGDG